MVNLEVFEVAPGVYEERTTIKEVGNEVTTKDLPSDENSFPFLDYSSVPVVDNSITVPKSPPSVVDEPSFLESLFESYLTDTKLLYHLEELGENFYAVINTFTFGELAIFILLFVFYLTYLLFKVWSVFR